MRCDVPLDRSSNTPTGVLTPTLSKPIADVHVYFNQVEKVLYQFGWEGCEFIRVRYLSCRCKNSMFGLLPQRRIWLIKLYIPDNVIGTKKNLVQPSSGSTGSLSSYDCNTYRPLTSKLATRWVDHMLYSWRIN